MNCIQAGLVGLWQANDRGSSWQATRLMIHFLCPWLAARRPRRSPARRVVRCEPLADNCLRTPTFQRLEERLLLAADTPIHLEPVANGLASPVVATHAADGSGRLFIAEQGGLIRILRDGVIEPGPFLNLGAGGLNLLVTGGERGLLGLAFHPDFAAPSAAGEGKFYVYYSATASGGGNHDSVVAEFRVSAANPDVADPGSRRELLRFTQPFSNHNGGDLHFGPDDGLLYISSGDGGSGGDPQNNAQNLANLLGKILRIDVDGSNGPNGQYGIPASNPFVGQAGVREEIFAFGLRNPYRFSIDDGPAGPASPDRLFVGDVGQQSFEEIDLVTAGGNYGWRIREGAHPFNTSDPDPGNLIDPIAEYANDATTDAVIGGFVYRGAQHPALSGLYIFGDLLGKMFVLEQSGNQFELSELNVRGGNPIGQGIIGFGEDEAGELYVLTFSALLAIDVRAPHPLEVGADLNGANGFVLNGVAADDDSGRSVGSAGDINGDGIDDLLIGADGADPNGNLSGESYVVFGRADGFAAGLELSALDGSNGFILHGVAAYDQSGLAVSSAGDVNGDGIDDLLIGALGSDAAGVDAGRSYVVFGQDTPFAANLSLASLSGSNGFAIDGAADNDFSGVSVAGGGDVNGDGFADVIVGAPYADPGGRSNAGAAYVVFGRANGFPAALDLAALDGSNGFAVNGVAAEDLAGFSVAAAGDVNGDGLDDLLIGAYRADINGALSGSAYVLFGRASGITPAFELSQLDGTNGLAIHGRGAGDYAGWAVGGGGDFNGDGLADVVLGAYLAGRNGNAAAGRSYVVFGRQGGFSGDLHVADLDGTNGFAIRGVAADDQSGRAVAFAGDVNGDGFDDLVIGARYADPAGRDAAGAAYLVFGTADALGATFDLAALDGSRGFALRGAQPGDFLGLALGAAGDLDGDGFHDFVVAAPGADPGGRSAAGASFAVLGADMSGSVTHLGDAADNLLSGTAGADNMVGAQGDDRLIGAGGADLLRGAAGDDLLAVADSAFRLVDGGRGQDTLRLDGNGISLDLTALPDRRVRGIERIDITGSGGNQLLLNLREVLNLSNTSNTLLVRADSNDHVDLGTGWQAGGIESVGNEFFDVFTQGAARVLVLRSDGPAWQNQRDPFDVNNDTAVAPVSDILPLVNELNFPTIIDAFGRLPIPPVPPNSPPPFYDVSGDDRLSPVQDILPIVNFLNGNSPEGEGEAARGAAPRSLPPGTAPLLVHLVIERNRSAGPSTGGAAPTPDLVRGPSFEIPATGKAAARAQRLSRDELLLSPRRELVALEDVLDELAVEWRRLGW